LRKAQGAPGLAVAVITKDVVYSHGLRHSRRRATRDHAHDLRHWVADEVLYLIGGGDAGGRRQVDWTSPSEYLPWFRLYDPHASELMTIRDLLTHRSGLPRYDMLRYAVPLPREELVKRLRYLLPTASFASGTSIRI